MKEVLICLAVLMTSIVYASASDAMDNSDIDMVNIILETKVYPPSCIHYTNTEQKMMVVEMLMSVANIENSIMLKSNGRYDRQLLNSKYDEMIKQIKRIDNGRIIIYARPEAIEGISGYISGYKDTVAIYVLFWKYNIYFRLYDIEYVVSCFGEGSDEIERLKYIHFGPFQIYNKSGGIEDI